MKTHLKKHVKKGFLMATIMAVFSCSQEETPEVISDETSISAAELVYSDETETISEAVLGIAEDVYATDEIKATLKGDYRSDFLPDCVTITTVITSISKEKTIDFGDGCELPNGHILGGIIHLSYLKDMALATKTLSLTLENFTFNGVAVAGSATVVRKRSNNNGNPQSDANAAFNATWPDGSTASFEGNRTREWIEGHGSGFWGDNVFLITGQGTYVGRLGNSFTKEIIEPLRREWSCRFIVSGVLEVSRNDATASLNFGEGNCDAVGILTHPDGSSEEIFLRRFLK